MWCDSWDLALPQGPVAVGVEDGDLGVGRSTCPTTGVGFAGGGSAIVETENLYGHIVATGTLRGSWAVTPRTELYASIEGIRFDSVIAPIAASSLGPGYTDLGANWVALSRDKWNVAVQGKFVLPTNFTVDQNSFSTAMDAGVAAGWAPIDAIAVHVSILGLYGMALGGGPAYPRAGANLTLGGEFRVTHGFVFVADAVTGFGYTDAVDIMGAAMGFRGAIGHHAALSLEALAPLAGRDRHLAAVDLRFDWRF